MMRRLIAFDMKCYELARYFFRDMNGISEEQIKELSARIRLLCDEYCREFEPAGPAPDG
jgi:hypothetical protein